LDFDYTDAQKALRRDVAQFIAENVTPDVAHEMDRHSGAVQSRGRGPLEAELFAKIAARGWLGIAYPKEYGGQGGSAIDQYIVEEEFIRHGITVSMIGSGAPAILSAGTEEQKRYYIPRLISGEVSFCLGFTEPHAGADLANLRCSAVRDGDSYVINGQKMYTTSAHRSTHIYLMARTDRTAARHDGISIFIFPMDTPGLSVRPLWTIQNEPTAPTNTTYGASRTNEVFFDDVRVDKSCLLGEENKGWRVGQSGLNLDRVGARRYYISVQRDEDLVNFAKSRDGVGQDIRTDGAMRDRIAELWIEAQVCRLMTLRSMSIVGAGGNFTYEGSAEKVWAPEHGVRISETITQMLGPHGSLLRTSPHAIDDGVYAHNVMGAFQSGVNHGSTQIMRDQVARRGLGMPSSRSSRKTEVKQ